MDFRVLLLITIITSFGCAWGGQVSKGNEESKYYSQIIKIGKSADLLVLADFVGNWEVIKNRIVAFDGRSCIAQGLSLEKLKFINIEGKERLSISATGFQHNLDVEEIQSVIGVEFDDPCDYDELESLPGWIIVKAQTGFYVIDFVQFAQ